MDEEPQILPAVQPDADRTEFEETARYISKNQIALIEDGMTGLQNLIQVAESSQHPRAYEVLATYLRAISEINRDLLTTAKEKRDNRAGQAPQAGKQVTNQLFVGSTAEVLEMLKKRNEDK